MKLHPYRIVIIKQMIMTNQSKFSQHKMLDTHSAADYVRHIPDCFNDDAELEVTEIGDGNINYVFRIIDKRTNRSVVIKQADRCLRASGRPLDLKRNKIEYEILTIESKLAPTQVPKIIDYNEIMCALTMEDISEYKNLRSEMASEIVHQNLANEISTFLVNTLLPTTDLIMDRHEKKRLVEEFINVDLCDISEDLVFTEPYWNYKSRNIITKGNELFVNERLYENEELITEVGLLRNSFMNNAQALIHGDLHSGSIFVNSNGIKVIDPEFAFYGPIGYDVGNVIGNLIFPWVNKKCTKSNNTDFIHWIEKTIVETIDLFRDKFDNKLRKEVKCPIYNVAFCEQYRNEVLADSFGFAGTEIIRRTVGDTKVSEISTVCNQAQRIDLDRALIEIGIMLIMNRHKYLNGDDVMKNCAKVMEEFDDD